MSASGSAGANAAGRAQGGPALLVEDLHVRFEGAEGAVVALDGIDLEVARGELVCLLGPSGCGKSTLLNAVAGFVKPTAGRVLVEGRSVSEPGPDRAMVFQEYALFPWMTVAQNVAFGLEIQRQPRAQVDAAVAKLLLTLSLTEFANRFPKDLSGGMRQRVAIARALALNAPMLLLDEPFGALDALTRRTLQDELVRVWSGLSTTALFVTHSIEESVYLADRVAVMTYRPGTIKKIVPIALPRPRDPSSQEFNALERELTALVMEEERRHQKDELGGR